MSNSPLSVSVMRKTAKRTEILSAATRLFLDNGYETTSMDAIAAMAQASKRTVYNYFPSKDVLFQAIVANLYNDLLDRQRDMIDAHEPPAIALPKLAQTILTHLRQPAVLGLLRLIIAEQPRRPDIAALFQNSGKGPAVELVESYLATQVKCGALALPDPLRAAQYYLGAIKEVVFWPLLLGLSTPDDDHPTISAVTVAFLKTYGVN